MTRTLMLLTAAGALFLGAGAAQAQADPPATGQPAGPGLMTENATVRNPGDTSERDMAAARDAEVARQRNRRESGKPRRAVPAKPGEVTAGSDIRDPAGLVVGTVESVTMSAAVVAAPGGKVEVPLEAFGKDARGLLISMPKAEFDAAVAAAGKPGG